MTGVRVVEHCRDNLVGVHRLNKLRVCVVWPGKGRNLCDSGCHARLPHEVGELFVSQLHPLSPLAQHTMGDMSYLLVGRPLRCRQDPPDASPRHMYRSTAQPRGKRFLPIFPRELAISTAARRRASARTNEMAGQVGPRWQALHAALGTHPRRMEVRTRWG